MKKYDAIVIGTGMGGMAAAMLLAHSGKKVAVFERNRRFGGRLGSFEKDGFTLDIGVHTISRGPNGPLVECLKRVGIEDALDFQVIRPIVSFEGRQFKFPRDLKTMVPEEDFNGLMQFMQDAKNATPEQLDEWDDISLRDLLNKYTTNEVIHTCVCRVGSVYCALPSWLESAGEFARCMSWESAAKSSGYPKGGCVSITNAYMTAIRDFGADVFSNAKVDKILVEDAKAVGVMVGGEEYRADMIVSNADIKPTVLTLAGEENFPADYVDDVKGLMYSWAGPVLRIALDEPLTDIKMLSQFGEIGQEQYYDKIAHGIMPKSLNIFFVVPSNFSPETAPEGRQLLCVATPVPTDTSEEVMLKLREALLDTIEGFIPNLRDHIMWIDSMSTRALNGIGGEQGDVIGIAQCVGQTGRHRPRIKTPLEGLYIVGGEAGGAGVGVELAVNSAEEFFDTYCA